MPSLCVLKHIHDIARHAYSLKNLDSKLFLGRKYPYTIFIYIFINLCLVYLHLHFLRTLLLKCFSDIFLCLVFVTELKDFTQ